MKKLVLMMVCLGILGCTAPIKKVEWFYKGKCYKGNEELVGITKQQFEELNKRCIGIKR